MPIVKLKDGTVVNIPDDASDEHLNELFGNEATPVKETSSFNLDTLKKKIGASGTIAKEAARVLDKSIRGGVFAIPNLAMDAGDAIARAVPEKYRGPNIPGLGETKDLIRQVTTPLEPETTAGKQMGNIGSSIVGSMVGPGTMLQKYMTGLGAGVGAEGAAVVAGDNPMSRIIGALLGGGVAGAITANKGNAQHLAKESLEGVQPTELDDAIVAMKRAKENGIDLNLAQALNRDTNVDAYVNALSVNPQGKRTAEVLRSQIPQVQDAIESTVGNLPGKVRDMHTIANRNQEAATSVFKNLDQEGSDIWKQAVTKGQLNAPKTIDPSITTRAIDRLDSIAARHPESSLEFALIQNLKGRLVDRGALVSDPEKAYQSIRSFKDDTGARQTLANRNITTSAAKYARGVAQDTLESLGAPLQPYRDADALFSKFKKAVVKPMKQSIIGRLAGKKGSVDDVEASMTPTEALFKKGTLPNAESQILKMEKEFREAGKSKEYQDSAKTYLAKMVDESFKSTTNRINQQAASNLTSRLGTETRPDNAFRGTEEILVGMARSLGLKDEQAYSKGFNRLMNSVSRVANRPGNVAGTNYQEIMDKASDNILKRTGQFSIITPLRQPILFLSEKLRTDSLTTIDKMLNSPEGVTMLRVLAKNPIESTKSNAAINTFLAANANLQSSQSSSKQTGE